MEAEKYHYLPSASLTAKKPSGVIQFEFEGLKIRSSDVKVQDVMDVPALAERENHPFLHRFFLFRPSTDWVMLIHVGENNLLFFKTNSNANFFWKQPSKNTQK